MNYQVKGEQGKEAAMSYQVTRSSTEIDDVLNRAGEAQDTGRSAWPGMSYEDGVAEALRWVLGLSDDNPMNG